MEFGLRPDTARSCHGTTMARAREGSVSGYESGGSSCCSDGMTGEEGANQSCTAYDTRSPQACTLDNHPSPPSPRSDLEMSPTPEHKSDGLPTNPLKWTTVDVMSWLNYIEGRYAIPNLDKKKFGMNGLGIALIPRRGFIKRLGHSGVLAHQDYHRRLRSN